MGEGKRREAGGKQEESFFFFFLKKRRGYKETTGLGNKTVLLLSVIRAVGKMLVRLRKGGEGKSLLGFSFSLFVNLVL